ncbi:MAG TPA: hypothetical protein VGD54_12290 [Steroidobacteraceae bacterium]
MTTLDQCLYAWLTEPDDKRFDIAFHSYYQLAYPAVIRRMARVSGWDLPQLEEIAQDALLKFFDRVGRVRRKDAETVANLLARLSPLNLGTHHRNQVLAWSSDIAEFASSAVSLRATSSNEELLPGVIPQADTILSLQRRGWSLIGEVGARLHCSAQPPVEADESQTRAETVLRELGATGAATPEAEQRLPGALRFIETVYGLAQSIPQLREPTNGLLFEIAMHVYLDVYKGRARKKRGGRGTATTKIPVAHPIEQMVAREPDDLSEAACLEQDAEPSHPYLWTSLDQPFDDPANRYENEEFLQRFYEYLRAPVDAAHEAYEAARLTGTAGVENRRLESLKGRFSRVMSVLALIGQGYTQEETAEYLRLSRNQIRYVVEIVQAAYGEFASKAWGPIRPTGLAGVADAL